MALAVVVGAASARAATEPDRAGTAPARDLAAAPLGLTHRTADPELARRVARLEARVRDLQRGPEQRRLDERRAAEIRTIVADVLADADSRTAWRQDELTAGHDGEFFVASADGMFRLEVTGQIQIRYVWDRQQKSGGRQDVLNDFDTRRAKVKMDGYLHGPDLAYTVQMARSDVTQGFVMQAMNVRYRLNEQVVLLLGRARPPLLREESVSSKRQLAVERSLISKAFSQTRTLGVTMRMNLGALKIHAGLMDASTSIFSEERWRASSRVELALVGRLKELDDFTSFPDDDPVVAVGCGVLFQTEDLDDTVENDTTLLRFSGDVSLELGGVNIFLAYVGNHLQEETLRTLQQFGVVAQGGIFLTDEWELFGRYEWGDADGADVDLSVVTVGVNRYFDRHALKWTLDVGYGISEVGSFWSSSGAGWGSDSTNQDGQVVGRMQFQLLF